MTFIECTEINLKGPGANGFFVSILLKIIGWGLGVIGNIHNDECIIYIFTGKFQNCTPSIFNKSLYHCWYT